MAVRKRTVSKTISISEKDLGSYEYLQLIKNVGPEKALHDYVMMRFALKKIDLDHIPNEEWEKFGLSEELVKAGFFQRDLTGYCWMAKSRPSEVRKDEKLGSETRGLILHYTKLWERHYNAKPPITAQIAGIAKQLVKDLTFVRACELLNTFFEMKSSYYVLKRHSLTIFKMSLEQVVAKHDGGMDISKKNAELFEDASMPSVSKMDIATAKLEKEIEQCQQTLKLPSGKSS